MMDAGSNQANAPSACPIPFGQINAILFDLDGTLLDTDDQAVERLARWLHPWLGHRAQPLARKLLMGAETPGNALITFLDLLGLDAALMHLTDRLRRRRGVFPAHQFRLIPGVAEMLPALGGAYRLGLVTSRSRPHIEAFLARFPQIGQHIAASCGLQDTFRLKPHPAPVRLAARRLAVPVENCLMVGDTVVDVKAARRAGAWSVAVLCGFGTRGELEKAGAHLILATTADLGAWLAPRGHA